MPSDRPPASNLPGASSSATPAEQDKPSTRPGSFELRVPPREYGGRKGLDPVRYGDWEKNGRCIDF